MSKKIEEETLGGPPNDKWAKFFDKFKEIETLKIDQWKVAHLLGYFVGKYKETYGVDYPWKYNNQNPNKSFEVWQMNMLAAKMSANPKIIKDYIDWAYANLVPKAKRRLTSISFMTKDEAVNPYKINVLLGGKKDLNVDRSTQLPTIYYEILREHFPSVATYGDLSFVYNMDPKPTALIHALDKMQELGFDPEVLKRIV